MMENKTKIDLKNKSIFITGVAGFIGSNLAKRLLSTVKGVKVVGLDNMNHYYDVRLKEARLNELEQFESFSFVKGNLADKAVIESIFEQYKPEIVVNLGAQAGVRYGETRASYLWEYSWMKEWLDTYNTDPERAEKALEELEKAFDMPYMGIDRCDDATRNYLRENIDKAKLGDPSGFTESIRANYAN